MKQLAIFLLAATSIFFAFCKSENGGVQEVKSGSAAELVRLPTNADGSVDTTKTAKMTFEEAIFVFDTVDQGAIVEHEFKFKNTGVAPLLIHEAVSSCGCTVPEFPKDPIPPGGSSAIRAKFNTDGKSFQQSKMIRVTANTFPNQTSVTLKGYVREKK